MAYQGFDITGKSCVITGGTSGIGREIALAFAGAGAKVLAGSTSEQKVAGIKQELGAGHEAVQLDVSDAASVKAAMDLAVQKFGRIDVVVNAAGIIKKVPAIDMSIEEFEKIARINLTGSFIVAQTAARIMKEQQPASNGERGNIIFIASINSFISLSGVTAYGASKCGVLGLTRGLANEWAQYGIRVNGIAPGVFPTELNRKLIEGTPRGEWIRQHTPMDRFGKTEELAGAAIYLASPAASFTTGETMVIDGGFLSRGV